MKKILYLTCLVSLVSFTVSVCDSSCLNCSDPNSAQTTCTACYSSYFLNGTNCILCKQCQNYYDGCSKCSSQNSTSSSNSGGASSGIYGIVFGIIGGLFIFSIVGIFVYKKCFKPIDPPPQANFASNHELIHIPEELKWSEGVQTVIQTQPCPICLEPGTLLKTHCQHMYHPECISAWVTKKQLNCPLCKATNLEPIKVYCPECLINYIEASLESIPDIQTEEKWKRCESCAQKQF